MGYGLQVIGQWLAVSVKVKVQNLEILVKDSSKDYN